MCALQSHAVFVPSFFFFLRVSIACRRLKANAETVVASTTMPTLDAELKEFLNELKVCVCACVCLVVHAILFYLPHIR